MTILRVERISKAFRYRTGFPPRKRRVPAVRDVTFEQSAGETLALIGESGAGNGQLRGSSRAPHPGR